VSQKIGTDRSVHATYMGAGVNIAAGFKQKWLVLTFEN
jgi:hypothetical protein